MLKGAHASVVKDDKLTKEDMMDDYFFLILNLLAEFTENIFLFMMATRGISSRGNKSNTWRHS